MRRLTAAITACLAGASGLTGCAGEDDSVCGNSVVESGEDCDDGNTTAGDGCSDRCHRPPRQPLDAIVKWEFNREAADGFDVDSCFDLGVARVEVELEGAAGTLTADESCGFRQVTFVDISPGDYAVRVRPLDSAGQLLTFAPIEDALTMIDTRVTRTVDVGFEDWVDSYTGTLFFNVTWAGAGECARADPPVAQQVLLLESGGRLVTRSTQDGDRLDGTAPGPCRAASASLPQVAVEVPWGPAVFTVRGLDSAGEVRFQSTFDTFVGAGLSNPTYTFDAARVGPDAGP